MSAAGPETKTPFVQEVMAKVIAATKEISAAQARFQGSVTKAMAIAIIRSHATVFRDPVFPGDPAANMQFADHLDSIAAVIDDTI